MKRIEKMVVCRPSFSGWQLTARLFSTLTATPSNSPNHQLNNQISSVQYQMTDWGKSTAYSLMAILWHDSREKDEKQ